MKKLRIIIRIITALLVVLTFVGIVLIAITDRDAVDTFYEIIAFSLGVAGMIMAVVSQIDFYQNEKQSRLLLKQIDDLNRDHDHDEKVDKQFQKKLDALLQIDQKIYTKVTKSAPECKKK